MLVLERGAVIAQDQQSLLPPAAVRDQFEHSAPTKQAQDRELQRSHDPTPAAGCRNRAIKIHPLRFMRGFPRLRFIAGLRRRAARAPLPPDLHPGKRASTTPDSADAKSGCRDLDAQRDVRRKVTGSPQRENTPDSRFAAPATTAPDCPVAGRTTSGPKVSETPFFGDK